MTATDVAYQRMCAQHLWGKPQPAPQDVVRSLTAMQAQEFGYAKWSVAQRCGQMKAAVEEALVNGAILRTHVLRPTWHFVAAQDIRWLTELTGPRVNAAVAAYYRNLELDDKIFARSAKVLARAVERCQYRTRPELADVLWKNKLPADNLQVICILMHAELDAILCSGPCRGKQRTYAAVEDRAPNARRLHADEALAEITLRYFTTHGPATLKDFRWWSSLKAGQVRAGLEAVQSQLEHETIDGQTFWFHPANAPAPPPPSPRIDLVQVYDECFMSYTESRPYMVDKSATGKHKFSHPVILNGRYIGSWVQKSRAPKSGTPTSSMQSKPHTVRINLLKPLTRPIKRALQEAVERYQSYLGAPISMQVDEAIE
jgi:hypothetical protein